MGKTAPWDSLQVGFKILRTTIAAGGWTRRRVLHGTVHAMLDNVLDALNPFKEDKTATLRAKKAEEEIGGKIDPILSTSGIKERLSDPKKVVGTGNKSLFQKVGPLVFFSGVPIIIGLYGFQEFANTGFDITVPIRLVVESLLVLAPVIYLIDLRAKSQGRELDFSKKDD